MRQSVLFRCSVFFAALTAGIALPACDHPKGTEENSDKGDDDDDDKGDCGCDKHDDCDDCDDDCNHECDGGCNGDDGGNNCWDAYEACV